MDDTRGSPEFYKLLNEMRDLHWRKSDNYATSQDPLSNFYECEKFGIPASSGAMIRLSDKFSRITQLMKGKKDLVGESIRDTLMDLASYALIEIILLQREVDKKPET